MLTINSTPAERERGCVFAENFKDNSSIIKNGGTVTGSLGFEKLKGAYFDSTNDYITYGAEVGTKLAQCSSLSIVIEFYPDFAADAGSSRYLCDATSGSRYTLNIASSGIMSVLLGNTTTNTIALASYQAYWKTEKRNVLVISGTTGSTQVYLNGTQISTSATAWTPASPANFYVGVRYNAVEKMYGWIKSVKIFNRKLTAQEALDYYNNQNNINAILNRAVINLPMMLKDHDYTNYRTLGRSGRGLNFTLGLGDGGNTTPTKLTKIGYDFDGTNDYIRYVSFTNYTAVASRGATFSFIFTPDFDWNANAKYSFLDISSGNKYVITKNNNAGSNTLDITMGGTALTSITSATYSPYWKKGAYNVLTVSCKTAVNNAWLNGVQIMTNEATAWIYSQRSTITLGYSSAGGYFDGKIHNFLYFMNVITPLQEIIIRNYLLSQVNKI